MFRGRVSPGTEDSERCELSLGLSPLVRAHECNVEPLELEHQFRNPKGGPENH